MSETCDTEVGGCKITCPSDCCYAYYFPETGVCVKGCCDEKLNNVKKQFNFTVDLETKVHLSVAGIELWKLGYIFDNILHGKIHIPAKIADQKVTKSLKDVTIKQAIDSLELKYITKID